MQTVEKPSSQTFAQIAAKQMPPKPAEAASPQNLHGSSAAGASSAVLGQKPSNYAIGSNSRAPVKRVLLPSKEDINQKSSKMYHLLGKAQAREVKKPAEQPKLQIVPPLKMTPQDAMKLLEQQQAGKINAKFSKYGNEAKDGEKEIIRRAVWGGA